MKIVDVKAYPLLAPREEVISGYLPYSETLSKTVRRAYASCFVKVLTDEEVAGVGESIVREVPEATAAIVERLLKPIVVGSDPFDVEVLWERMFNALRTRGHSRGYFVEAISGVDCALWDTMGKALRLPVHKLLGGAHEDRVKAYASSILFGSTTEVAEKARELVEKGHDQMKLKVGMEPERDVENVQALRDAVGYGVDLMVDANSGYNAHTAIRVGRKFERYECYWLEEPVPPDDLGGYVEVSRALDMPVCGSESLFGRYDYRELIAKRAVDIVQPDIARSGGISECRKIAAMAEAFNKPYTPHVGLSGAGCRAATLQFVATLPREIFLTYEYMFMPNPLAEEVLAEPIENFKDGYVELPKRPGLCLELKEEAMSKYLVK